jgi:hypothetical protein
VFVRGLEKLASDKHWLITKIKKITDKKVFITLALGAYVIKLL